MPTEEEVAFAAQLDQFDAQGTMTRSSLLASGVQGNAAELSTMNTQLVNLVSGLRTALRQANAQLAQLGAQTVLPPAPAEAAVTPIRQPRQQRRHPAAKPAPLKKRSAKRK